MRKLVGKRRWFLRFFKECDCHVGWTCKVLGISRSTAYAWFKKYPKLRERVREARENWKNREKSPEELEEERQARLYKRAMKGEVNAIIRWLGTYARDRGYRLPGEK
jgi:transposase